jgi:hypothetical protein
LQADFVQAIFMDERADEAQRHALQTVFSGPASTLLSSGAGLDLIG